MAEAAGGSPEAFDVLVRRHQAVMLRFAARMLGGDTNRAEDAAVGAFLRLWETRATFVACGKLDAWLLSTTYRLCVDQIRQTANVRPLDAYDAREQPSHLGPERAALANAVRDAVMDLADEFRAVVVLTVYEGLSYEEVGHVLGIPAGTVASRKNQAMAKLRGRLAAWEEQ